ncbi:MAG: CoA-binding protein [Acidobacteria bacterium]|nr:MAG: CoA-binding protein [Acidobacteriota bacterium]REK11043.1 MAG: CoA-binding protein [Acidobacteriota bacterium]
MARQVTHDDYRDEDLRRILQGTRTVAMVGASANWKRPSAFVMKYLQSKGFRVLPINPKLAAEGTPVLGEQAWPSLAEAPGPYEMVDVFRNSEAAAGVVDEAIALMGEKGIRYVWMQLGVRNDEAARRAEAAGLEVVMNRCPKIEWSRLHLELAWSGVNTGIVSARRPRLVVGS